MAYLLFVDESGHDRVASPYEVLAEIAVQDRDIWNLINALHDAEIRNFGRRYSAGTAELKGTKILKKKVFAHAQLNVAIEAEEVSICARHALDHGAAATVKDLKALALAKMSYVRNVFEICARFRSKAFASIVETDAHETASHGLRKDYAYLFGRFFYFLEDLRVPEQGIVVFDELEKAKSHLLIDQMHRYFRETATGQHRASLIVPEPFFVHSDLTTGVQIADLIAYIVSWGWRTQQMRKRARAELAPYAQQISSLRNRAVRERGEISDFVIWSFSHMTDLRTRIERGYVE
jgi:hypothetical protein